MGKWQTRTSLPAPRDQGGAAVFRNEACAAGGYHGVIHFRDVRAELIKPVECFDGTRWEQVSSLPVLTTSPAVTNFLNRFFVVGGSNFADMNVSLTNVQAFDGHNWTVS